MAKLSIIMPAYNEEKRIGKTLNDYSRYFELLHIAEKIDYDIIVVINNTTDKTEEIVRRYVKENKRIIFVNLKPGGKGFAIIEGFKIALERGSDIIGFVDADLATRPEDYYALIKNLGNCDGLIASRYIKGSEINPKPTLPRLVARKMFNYLIRSILFMPYRDTQCGAKVFRRRAVEKVIHKIGMSKWAFDVDLLYSLRKNGFIIREYPTRWFDKEYSKINFWRSGPWMALAVVRLRLLNSHFNVFIRVYDFALKQIRGK
jgi:glycosyltransferase involved in cell wall biosynthesis